MRKSGWLVVFIVLLAVIAVAFYLEASADSRRKRNFALTKGKILQANMDINNGHKVAITYLIKIAGREITRMADYDNDRQTCVSSLQQLMNTELDVVYERGDPENCELLLSKAAYDEYKLTPSKEIAYLLGALTAACGEAKD